MSKFNPAGFPADLAATIARHREEFAGWKMQAETTPDPAPAEPVTEPADEASTEPDAPELGDAGKKALAAERTAKRDAEKRVKELEARVNEFEDATKSETEKATGKATKAEQERSDAITERDTAVAAQHHAERTLAVYQNAGDADPARLLKFTDFLDAIKEVEPTDTKGINAAIKAAVTDNPWLRRVGGSNGDTSHGHSTPPERVLPGVPRLAAAFEQNLSTR